MIGALLYLRVTSLCNLVVYRVRRLRQPRYLVGAVAAACYLYFFFLRRFRLAVTSSGAAPGLAAEVIPIVVDCVCVLAVALAVIVIAFAWISPPAAAGLQFSEAEIAFLFPAPISRRGLIHFRLMSSQLAILFTSVLMASAFARYSPGAGPFVIRTAGLWVILSTFSLHLAGTHLTVARLRERGARSALWRSAVVAGIALYVTAIIRSAVAFTRLPSSVPLMAAQTPNLVVPALLASSPFRWLILPFRIVFAPCFAGDLGGLLLAIVPALALLALHYHWVSAAEFKFEEGSIALATKRASVRAAMLTGEGPKAGLFRARAQPGPFPLSPKGPPEVAFLWKNLLSMRSSLLSRRAAGLALVATVLLSLVLRAIVLASGGPGTVHVYAPVIAGLCAVAAGYTLLLGPQIARQDLRSDLPNVDILKTFPVEGWRLVLGELLAPAAILSALLWFFIIVGSFAFDADGAIGWLTPGVRVTAALCLGAATPVVCLAQLIVPNLLAVLLPGWYQASRARGGGIENFGQRLILGVAQAVFDFVFAAPLVVVAALIIFSSHLYIGVVPSIVLAAAVVLPVLAGEAAVGVWLVGERFASFDLSTEVR